MNLCLAIEKSEKNTLSEGPQRGLVSPEIVISFDPPTAVQHPTPLSAPIVHPTTTRPQFLLDSPTNVRSNTNE